MWFRILHDLHFLHVSVHVADAKIHLESVSPGDVLEKCHGNAHGVLHSCGLDIVARDEEIFGLQRCVIGLLLCMELVDDFSKCFPWVSERQIEVSQVGCTFCCEETWRQSVPAVPRFIGKEMWNPVFTKSVAPEDCNWVAHVACGSGALRLWFTLWCACFPASLLVSRAYCRPWIGGARGALNFNQGACENAYCELSKNVPSYMRRKEYLVMHY